MGATMRGRVLLLAVLALQLALLLQGPAGTAQAVKRDQEDSDEDVSLDESSEPVIPASKSATPGRKHEGQFSAKLPKHLAEHYQNKGLDNVVYFSFCIA